MLKLVEALDSVNRLVGSGVRWLALLMVLLQFGIVLLRYLFGISYVFFSETVLYMHAALFMLGAGYTLLIDKHVRVDIFYAGRSPRGRAMVNIQGAIVLLLPTIALILWVTFPFVRNSWAVLEGPMSVGGIPASFLLKSLIPAFCVLLLVQGVACLLRDLARLGDEGIREPRP